MQSVIETPSYLSEAKAADISDEERSVIVDFLAMKPMAGDEIAGSGGARKVRFAGRGKGKSGGYRVVTFYSGIDIPLFLLNVFAKGERANLSKAEVNTLRVVLGTLADIYRTGARRT